MNFKRSVVEIDYTALLLKLYYALNYIAQRLDYLSYEDMHDLNISPDFLSHPDSSLSREKLGPCLVCCSEESF